jgi:hypothetical protein
MHNIPQNMRENAQTSKGKIKGQAAPTGIDRESRSKNWALSLLFISEGKIHLSPERNYFSLVVQLHVKFFDFSNP